MSVYPVFAALWNYALAQMGGCGHGAAAVLLIAFMVDIIVLHCFMINYKAGIGN